MNGREEGGQYYISQTCDQQRFEATFLQLVLVVWVGLELGTSESPPLSHACCLCNMFPIVLSLLKVPDAVLSYS